MYKKKHLFLSILSLSLFLLIVFIGMSDELYGLANKDNVTPKRTSLLHQEKAEPKLKTSIRTEVRFSAIGDVLIHNSLYEDAKTQDGYDFTPMFADVKPALMSADLTFANQETIIGGESLGLSSYPRFNSPYQVGDLLLDSGVDIVSMANNHTLDKGEIGILNAINYYNQIGIEYVGAHKNKEDKSKQRILHRNGMDIGFIAYTYGTNGLKIPNGKDYLVNIINQEMIIQSIQQMKSDVDFVVVSLHFGLEDQRIPNNNQQKLVHALSDAGADIILGHHPHVLQPVDWIENEDGSRTFVIYSLGNFLSGQAKTYQRIGCVLNLTLEKEIKNGQIFNRMTSVAITPTYNYRPGYRNYKIVSLFEADQYGLENAKELYEEISNHMKMYTDDVTILTDF